MDIPYEKDNLERVPFEHYLAEYEKLDPVEASMRTGVPYDARVNQFDVRLMGYSYRVGFPDFSVEITDGRKDGVFLLEEMPAAKIIVMRFLISGQYVPGGGKYLTFREIPWGEVYFKPFEGRCLTRLKYAFGFKLDKFSEAMEKMGAVKLGLGDASYEFEFINGLHVRFILWTGDDEFPPASQILFEDNFPYAYQAEDLAHVGDISITTLKRLAG